MNRKYSLAADDHVQTIFGETSEDKQMLKILKKPNVLTFLNKI